MSQGTLEEFRISQPTENFQGLKRVDSLCVAGSKALEQVQNGGVRHVSDLALCASF
jgi:hypothetical protein